MGKYSPLLEKYLFGVMCLLAVCILLCLVRAILGPRYTDRVLALNIICTLVILLICILSCLLEEVYLVDVAILYGLLNLLAIALLSRVAIGHHREERRNRP